MSELRERVAWVLVHFRPSRTATIDEGIRETADAVLDDLGLDDLDAAVERVWRALWEQRGISLNKNDARCALEAALTPPEGAA